jgi:hypothetical protein
MGRYYDGDIEGKFWFAVQSSDDGEHFGCTECGSNVIEYYVDRDTFNDVGIKQIKELKRKLSFKHVQQTGTGKKDTKYNHYDLWQEWNKYVDDFQKEHSDNRNKMFNYLQYENWLLEFKDIGTGKPQNGDRDTPEQEAYFEHEKQMRPIWEWLARLTMGYKMKGFFDDNPDTEELYFSAEC